MTSDGGILKPKPQTVNFTFTIDTATLSRFVPEWKNGEHGESNKKVDWSPLSLVYINQQNAPRSEKLVDVHFDGVVRDTVSFIFEADFPFDGTSFGNGLTIAALVPCGKDISSVDAVSKNTIAGPGLIEVN